MQSITQRQIIQLIQIRLHVLVILSVVVLALAGRLPESRAGWMTCPPQIALSAPTGRQRRGPAGRDTARPATDPWRWYLCHTWHVPLLRNLLLGVLWQLSGQEGPAWVSLIPWVQWLWQSGEMRWPWLRRQPEWQAVGWLLRQGQSWISIALAGLSLGALLRGQVVTFPLRVLGRAGGGSGPWVLGLGCVVCDRTEPGVEVVREEDGNYTATLCGHYTLHVAGDQPFRIRQLMLFLRLLEVSGPQRGGRRTRDGRTPFVSQEQLATWFSMPQPDISRIEKYWLEGDWANLLSLKTAEVLTGELLARIVGVFASFPWWGVAKVYQYLQGQGVAVSERQVRQAAEQSGWSQLRQELVRRYHLTAESIRPQDNWLVEQLLAQNQTLLAKLEVGEGLTPEEQIAVADLQALAGEVGVVAQPPLPALPWLMRVERVVFGHWAEVLDGTVRCTSCGSPHVVRKSRQPRLKKYYDAEGNLQTVEVYRYYCRNPLCDQKTFTNLPPGLAPYSRYRVETHLLALQMYAWGYSTYRRTGTALGVASMTTYRWVSAWGYALLPVAALFGVVKSSGVVGVDEKYVLVPKACGERSRTNDKPAGKMRRWMYVYLAVDVWTYDLLHIAIYPHNDEASAAAFLLALRAKGYHPQVIVTDLRQDYGPVIAQVFPQAAHHECIFHALQQAQKHVKDVYGPDYATHHPEAEQLKQQLYRIFDADTLTLATERYTAVLALRQEYVTARPEAEAIFDFLERHWPRLNNSIGSNLIPATNNTVERVIGRFDQHYQNFCGFESIADAQCYLAVFEKIYRFTPFSQDAQPGVRGKCPLELAGYDISQVPMAALCAGWSPAWPLEVAQNHVPNS